MCNLANYTLAWWHMPPFVSHGESGTMAGIMIAAIYDAAVLCCKGNSNVHFNASNSKNQGLLPNRFMQFDGQEQMLNNMTEENMLALPVIIPSAVAAMKPSEYFIRMVDSSGMVHVGRPGEPVTHVLLEALVAIWPLLAGIVVLTGYSAIILWLLHYRNHSKQGALHSLFDWYWFSFITAATVGYGDKVPQGIISKCFTMLWAVLGISVMAGTTATLTTLLAEHQQSITSLQSIKGQKVGVMTGSIERRFVTQLGGFPAEYNNVDEMLRAMVTEEIDHVAVDHYSFHHHFNSSNLDNFKYEIVDTPDVTVGYILFLPGGSNRRFLECLRFRSFLTELSIDTQLIRNIDHESSGADDDESNPKIALKNAAKTLFSSGLKITLLFLGLICLVVTVIIAACHLIKMSTCQNRELSKDSGEQSSENSGIEEKNGENKPAMANNPIKAQPSMSIKEKVDSISIVKEEAKNSNDAVIAIGAPIF